MGDCHYQDGNLNAKRRMKYAADLLEQVGLERERVRMVNISSAMGAQFAELVTEMSEQLKGLGPSPLRVDD